MNPFKILELIPGATKAEIVKAAAGALRTGRFSAKEIAVAQKSLLNPVKNAELLLLNPDFDAWSASFSVEPPGITDLSSLDRPVDWSGS